MARLVVVLSKAGQAMEKVPYGFISMINQTCFGAVHVWANDRDSRGQVVHTVNCGMRDDMAAPIYNLKFEEGDWGLKTR